MENNPGTQRKSNPAVTATLHKCIVSTQSFAELKLMHKISISMCDYINKRPLIHSVYYGYISAKSFTNFHFETYNGLYRLGNKHASIAVRCVATTKILLTL